ncbi:MAG: Arm DNA-binding domain-containing protein [Pseudomonadota bacterium]
MALKMHKLSALGVGRISKPGHYGDGMGLWLQVSKSVTKSWVSRYSLNHRARKMGLGSVLTVSPSAARERAKECRAVLLEGHDRLDKRDAQSTADKLVLAKAISFDKCAAAYIAAHKGSWKNAKHASQWANTLATYATPLRIFAGRRGCHRREPGGCLRRLVVYRLVKIPKNNKTIIIVRKATITPIPIEAIGP